MTENSIKLRNQSDFSPVPRSSVYTAVKDGHVPTESVIKPRNRLLHDKPIPKIYAEIDSDLARDNLENHITAADLQDL